MSWIRVTWCSFMHWCHEIRHLTIEDFYNAAATDPDEEGTP